MSDKKKKSEGGVVVVSNAAELSSLLGRAPADDKPHEDKLVETEHSLTIEGETLTYTATAGTYRVKLDDKPPVDLFYVAYVRTDVPSRDRPVTFAFNGGPGSSSVWLHMGFLGPKRVEADVGSLPKPPGRAVDNPLTLLTTSDLVFIDPTSTGYSRPAEGEGREYHEVTADIESVGELIRRWVTANGRWASPKFLAGESYGTTRAAGLAAHLMERGMALNGLVLVSLVLQFETLLSHENNWMPAALMLPAAAATALYHGRARSSGTVWERHKEVEAFMLDTYVPALMRGDRVPQGMRRTLAERIGSYTGVSTDFVMRCDLRLELSRFCRELLRHDRWVVGRLDSRFVGRERDAQGEHLEHDPALGALIGPYTAAVHDHLHGTLEYTESHPYRILNRKVWPWTFDGCENRFLDVGSRLREAMNANTQLKVFVASGVYDLATPWAAAEYTLGQLQLEPERRADITSKCYEAGHMMYAHEPSAKALRADLEAWFQGAC